MKKNTKAALLSGLVLPGIGQLYLKKYFLGVVFIIYTIIGATLVAQKIIVILLAAINKILFNIQHNSNFNIVELIKNLPESKNLLLYEVLGYLCLFVWVASIINALMYKDAELDAEKKSSN